MKYAMIAGFEPKIAIVEFLLTRPKYLENVFCIYNSTCRQTLDTMKDHDMRFQELIQFCHDDDCYFLFQCGDNEEIPYMVSINKDDSVCFKESYDDKCVIVDDDKDKKNVYVLNYDDYTYECLSNINMDNQEEADMTMYESVFIIWNQS